MVKSSWHHNICSRLLNRRITIYIDVLEVRDLLRTFVTLPIYLWKMIKEELFWWLVLYPFEISYPIDTERLHRECLAESRRRIEHNKTKKITVIQSMKGKACPYKPITCQEGYCQDCEIKEGGKKCLTKN